MEGEEQGSSDQAPSQSEPAPMDTTKPAPPPLPDLELDVHFRSEDAPVRTKIVETRTKSEMKNE
jgi:hypothetical protein